jgi:hypothetical protein
MLKFTVLTISLLFPIVAAAQITNRENYGLSPMSNKRDCSTVKEVLNTAPADARFGTMLKGDSVFIYHSDVDWLNKIIESRNDGLAIDLVQREQFACDNISRFAGSWSHRGYLLPPVYKNQLKERMKVDEGRATMFAGLIPPNIKSENVEANYLIISNNFVCENGAMVNVDYHGWKLLEMGLYYDTLTTDKLTKYKSLSKTLRFVIPFEKNKAEYNEDDIKPMYDSLQMTDYAISSIFIQAFTSVEGSSEHNLKLQNRRAQSVVKALQTFQSEKIESHVTAAENWVEFLNDLPATGQTSWITLSKADIKKNLSSKEMLNRFEPLLQTHRKAIIEIQLEKRLSHRESDPDKLKEYFEQTIAEKNFEEALYLQQIIFHKIKHHEIPTEYLEELDIPQATDYGGLLINEAAFMHEQDYSDVFEALETFEALDRLLPENPKIKYNLCALRLESWVLSPKVTDREVVKKSIEALSKYQINDLLIRRMTINYYIVLSEVFYIDRNYQAKNQAVDFIFKAYLPLKLNDEDLVNLSKYFLHYSHFDRARSILEPRIESITTSEDLIFYYLSLTIYDRKYTAGTSYRKTMLNAINMNRRRFCDLFLPSHAGGISFQLLEDNFLKKTYCENCETLNK